MIWRDGQAAVLVFALLFQSKLARSTYRGKFADEAQVCREDQDSTTLLSYCSDSGSWSSGCLGHRRKVRKCEERWISKYCDSRSLKTSLPRRNVLFAGDSTVWRLHRAAVRLKSDVCRSTHAGTRCALHEWCRLPRGNLQGFSSASSQSENRKKNKR